MSFLIYLEYIFSEKLIYPFKISNVIFFIDKIKNGI